MAHATSVLAVVRDVRHAAGARAKRYRLLTLPLLAISPVILALRHWSRPGSGSRFWACTSSWPGTAAAQNPAIDTSIEAAENGNG